MAAVTGAVVGAAATAYGAKQQAGAAKKAARAQGDAAQLGIDEQRRQFDAFQQNIQPYLGAGQTALGRLDALNTGDYSGFESSPDYLFARDQGLQSLERGAAARGGFMGGGADADRMQFASGLASQNLGNFRGNLMQLAGMGQNAAVGAGQLGQQSANNIGGLYGNMGQAQAGGAINSANAWSNALAGLGGAAGQIAGSMGGRQSSYQNPGGNVWGAFAPNQPGFSNATTQPYMGQSVFGQWGQGWGG